jgi:hypothetical protein
MTTRQSRIIKTVPIKPFELSANDCKSLSVFWGENLSQNFINEIGSYIDIYRKTLPLVKATTPASVKKSLEKLIDVNLDFLSRAIDQETDDKLRCKINELVSIAHARILELEVLRLNTSSEARRLLKESLINFFRLFSPYKGDEKSCLKFVCGVFDIAGINRPDWEIHPQRFWNEVN